MNPALYQLIQFFCVMVFFMCIAGAACILAIEAVHSFKDEPEKKTVKERIRCPACGLHQDAEIELGEVFDSYVHECEQCGFVITESDWEAVQLNDQQRWKEIVRDAQESVDDCDGYEADRAIVWANERIKELEKAHVRYETVRKLNPVKFAKLYRRNIDSGEHFDSLVDKVASGEATL